MANIRKGDLVQVISGPTQARGGDRGKQGRVKEVLVEKNRVIVEGINFVTKHTRVGQTARGTKTGGLETFESPIHISNVALVDPKTKKPYFTPGDNCTSNVISSGVADTINNILMKDVMPGNAGQTAARAYTGDGREIAGKSGTAQGNASYTFVGFTPQIVASVMAYNPANNDPLPAPGAGEQGFGGGYPATMWRLAMQNILNSYPKVSFPPPDPQVEAGNSSNSNNAGSGNNGNGGSGTSSTSGG